MTTIEDAAAAAAAAGEGLIGIDTMIRTVKAITGTGAVVVEALVAAQAGVAALSGSRAVAEVKAAAGMLRIGRSTGLMREKSLHIGKGVMAHLGIEALRWLAVHPLPRLTISLQHARVHLVEGGAHLLMIEMPAGVVVDLRSFAPAASLPTWMSRSSVQTEWQLLISYSSRSWCDVLLWCILVMDWLYWLAQVSNSLCQKALCFLDVVEWGRGCAGSCGGPFDGEVWQGSCF